MAFGVVQFAVDRSRLLNLVRTAFISSLLFAVPDSASAFELMDGRFQAHGYFESQLRVLNEDFGEDWDVAQWYQVLNLELELDIIDEPVIGIDLLSAFVRLEVRYDCVYSHGCGMFRSINAYGDDSQSLPRRLSNARDEDTAGELLISRNGRLSGATTDPVPLEDLFGFRLATETGAQSVFLKTRGFGTGSNCNLEDVKDANCFFGPTPFSLNFEDFDDYRFTQIHTRTGGISRLGPWLPKNNVDAIGTFANVPNPFDSTAVSEVSFAGYLDHEGFPTEAINVWDASEDILPPGVLDGDPDANLQTDPTVDVTVNLTYPELAGGPAALRLPLLTTDPNDEDQIPYVLNAAGKGSNTEPISLRYPRLGSTGRGANPYRPIPVVDHDEAFYFGPDVEQLELNVDCERTAVGGTSCYVEEIGETIVYNAADEIIETNDFSVKFQEYYRDLQVSMRTVCPAGDMGCFERVFNEDMDDEGFAIGCAGPPGSSCKDPLAELIEDTFSKISSLNCLESEWDCSDRLLQRVEDAVAELEADGHTLTCDAGVDCDVEISKYLIRFGTHYVISATRSDSIARGNFIPSKPLKRLLESGRLDTNPVNISESDRAWNRGYSQNDEKELKEAYFDIELMDSRLWLRVGKQSIVWGKTELFRTTDQFNPQDLALASLPSLEESRINLWAFRAVYSLYDVAMFSDVRLEFAFNFDDFQANDLGACGEAFTPNLVCELTLSSVVHGMTGVGVAGVIEPEHRWFDPRAWEIGGRVEWRWDRFSFALTDFWGFNDAPTIEFLTQFQRNVDPFSGRPRRYGYSGRCNTDEQDVITTRQSLVLDVNNNNAQGFVDAIMADSSGGAGNPSILSQYQSGGDLSESCLRPGPTHREPHLANLPSDQDLTDLLGSAAALRELREIPGLLNPLDLRLPVNNSYRAFIDGNALDEHHANLNLFTWVCSSTVGFNALDANSCSQSIFGSSRDALGFGSISSLIGALSAGEPDTNFLATVLLGVNSDFLPISLPLVQLQEYESADPLKVAFRRENQSYGCFDPKHSAGDFNPANIGLGDRSYIGCGFSEGKLSRSFTPEQEALLGCGPFFGTNCDESGIDPLNADASAILQSFVGTEGTSEALRIFKRQLKKAGRGDVDVYFRTDGWIPFLSREFNKPKKKGEAPVLLIDDPNVAPLLQPGTVRWRQAGIDTPVCTTADLKGKKSKDAHGNTIRASSRLPGCRGLIDTANGVGGLTARDIALQHVQGVGMQMDVIDDYLLSENFHLQSGNKGFFINEELFLFHQYVPDSKGARDGGGNIIDVNMDGRPDIKYPGIDCSPDLASDCFAAFVGFEDRADLHNLWDKGYKIEVDGSPLKLRLRSQSDSAFDLLRLPGQLPADSGLRNRATPNCPGCPQLVVDFIAGTNDQLGSGHPLTGDIFTSELAGWSYNFMTMLVALDEDFQLIIDTITSGPTGIDNSLPRSVRESYATLYDPAGPGFNESQGNCHVGARGTAPQTTPTDPDVLEYCGAERRRIAVHYAFSGDEWGTRDPNEVFVDPWLSTKNAEPFSLTYDYVENRFVDMEILTADSTKGSGKFIKAGKHCSFVTPQHCKLIQDIFAIAGVQNRSIKAGGNGKFGRRTFIWHSGGEVVLEYDRRNVLGLALDFAEDVTRSNWGMEFTWVEGVRVEDYAEWDGLTTVDEFNLTVSIDRPTFIHFLNPNHTFFFNTQWFFQYRDGYKSSMPANGPINVLGLVFVQTGYFQDRLLPGLTGVYDFRSRSGAALPQVTYRYTENFSIAVGANIFMGREQVHEMPVAGIGPASNQRGEYAYKVGVENGISAFRDRDEVFMRLRYTY